VHRAATEIGKEQNADRADTGEREHILEPVDVAHDGVG
jgi:hypothetical protein